MVQIFFFICYFLDTNKLPHETKNCEIRPYPYAACIEGAWLRALRQTKVLLTLAQKKQHICNIFKFNFSHIYVVHFTLNAHAELVSADY